MDPTPLHWLPHFSTQRSARYTLINHTVHCTGWTEKYTNNCIERGCKQNFLHFILVQFTLHKSWKVSTKVYCQAVPATVFHCDSGTMPFALDHHRLATFLTFAVQGLGFTLHQEQEGSPFTPPYLVPLPSPAPATAQVAQWGENYCRKNYQVLPAFAELATNLEIYVKKLGVKLSACQSDNSKLKISNLRKGIGRGLYSSLFREKPP